MLGVVLTADGTQPEGTPRWVKMLVVAGLVLVAVIVILLIIGGHGPGRHALTGSAAARL